jgi:hypothetical protein
MGAGWARRRAGGAFVARTTAAPVGGGAAAAGRACFSRAMVSFRSSAGWRYFLLKRCFRMQGRPQNVVSHTRCGGWAGGRGRCGRGRR